MSHDSCSTILTQSVAQCAQICADGGATIKQSRRLMALSQIADVDARTRGFRILLVALLTTFRDLCDLEAGGVVLRLIQQAIFPLYGSRTVTQV